MAEVKAEKVPEIVSVRILTDGPGIGPSNERNVRKADGWTFRDTPEGVWCRKAPRSTLATAKGKTFLYRVGHGITVVEYDAD